MIPWPARFDSLGIYETTSWRSLGLGNGLKVRAQRQTHSTLQLSLSVQIVGYPKEETDRVRQTLSPLVLKVLCCGIFHAFGHLRENGVPTSNRFIRWHLSCCYRVQSLVEEPSTEQAFVHPVADSISP